MRSQLGISYYFSTRKWNSRKLSEKKVNKRILLKSLIILETDVTKVGKKSFSFFYNVMLLL